MTKLQLTGHYSPERIPVLLYPDGDAGELMTKQSDAEACDINNILHQFTRTGLIEHVNQSTAQWADLPSDVDYQNSLHVVMEAQAAFESLPAPLRKKYDNDPQTFLDALQDPAERQFLTDHGVFQPPVVPPHDVAASGTSTAPSGGGAAPS